jgi:PAS domain S-box-containing protein
MARTDTGDARVTGTDAGHTELRFHRLRAVAQALSLAARTHDAARFLLREALDAVAAAAGGIVLHEAEDDMLRVVAAEGYPPEVMAEWTVFPAAPGTPASDALLGGVPVVLRSTEERNERYPRLARLPDLGHHAWAAVPMRVGAHTIGVLTLSFGDGAVLDDDTVRFLESLAQQCGLAVERLRLHEAERLASARAEKAAARTRRLFEVTAALAALTEPDEIYDLCVRQAVWATDAAAGWLVVPEGDDLVRAASIGYGNDVVQSWARFPVAAGVPAAETFRTGSVVVASSSDDLVRRFPALRGGALESLEAVITVPLSVGERTIGVMALQYPERRRFENDEIELVVAIARQCAVAVQRTTALASERDLALRARRLLESNVIGTIVEGDDGRIVEANDAFLQTVGYTREDLEAGRVRWRDMTPPEHLDRSLRALQDTRLSGRSGSFEKEYVRKDGTRVAAEVGFALLSEDPFRAIGYVLDLTERRRAEQDRAELLRQEQAAREQAERARDRLAFLAEASHTLSESLDYERTLSQVARLAVPRLADWCSVDIVADDGSIRQLAVAHVDPAKVDLARQLRRRYPVDPEQPVGVPNVIRTRRSELHPEITDEVIELATRDQPEVRHLVHELQLRSAMIVPLVARDRAVGTIQFVWAESGHRYNEEDLALAESLAARAAVAIDNARLFQAERAARSDAEAANTRLRLLADLGAALTSSLDRDAIARRVTTLIAEGFSDHAAVYLVEPGAPLRVASLGSPTTPPHGGAPFGVDLAVVDEAVRAGTTQPLPAPDVGVVVPLRAGDEPLGALILVSTQSRGYEGLDLVFVEELARRVSQALDNARLYEERAAIADTLQQSLLPSALPRFPSVELAGAYRPAGDGSQVGGDFYDAFPTTGSDSAIVIGDVCGKGARAAVVMALARYTVRAAALTEGKPSAVLTTLNDALLHHGDGDRFCTACYVRVHPRDRGVRVTVASGGHPLPLILRPDGSLATVGRPGSLLGTFHDTSLVDAWADLDPGDALILYTDGVTEERSGAEAFGERRLGEVLRACAGLPADAIAKSLIDAVVSFHPGDPQDDVAIVVARVV